MTVVNGHSEVAAAPGRAADALAASSRERRVLLLAPTANDSRVTASVLNQAGFSTSACVSMEDVCTALSQGCGTIIVAEESLGQGNIPRFVEVLGAQPSWSDVPVTIITSRGEAAQWRVRRLAALGLGGNVTLLERPFHPETLLSTVVVGMRSRLRQYQVRDLLAAQRESERRLQSIFESIAEPFVALDRDWRFTYVNRSYMKLVAPLYTSARELLGQVLWEKFPDVAGSDVGLFYRQVMATRKPGFMELFYEPLHAWLEVRAYPSREMLAIHVRDITERRHAADVLRKRSERMQLLSEMLGHLIGARDPQTVVRELFPKVAAHLDVDTYFNFMVDESGKALVLHSCAGISPEMAESIKRLQFGEAICGTVAMIREPIVASDIQHSTYDKANLVRGLGIQTYACNPLMVGDRLLGTLSFASRTRPSFAPDELEFLRLISQYVAIALDRLGTSETLRKNAQQLGVALGAANLGSWSWDSRTDRVTFSQRSSEIFGVETDGGSTRELMRDLIHPDDRGRAAAAARQAAETRTDYDIEYRIRRPDGEERWIAAKGRCVFASDGLFTGMLGVAQDITDRKQAEVRLHEAKEAAEAANRSKDRFLAVLSHELRTPLTPVLMASAVLEVDARLPAEVKEDMAMIRRNVELEAKIIDDLLDISRITSGKLNLRMESVDVNTAVRQVCVMCGSQIVDKAIRLDCDLAGSVGTVSADLARLQQVLWNLLNNAVKFTPSGGVVHISSRRTDGSIILQVRDSGMGIDRELLPQIFNAFEQGDVRITRQFGGLGLGLAITKVLVELHGGTIVAESGGRGHGAAFTVTLPAEPRHEAREAAPAPVEPAPHRSVRLLLVEDHVDTSRVLSIHLRRAGYEVTLAGNVATALRLAREQAFDILVSDLGLPDQTGFELMRQIQKIRPMPGIAMSGYGMVEDLRKSRASGFSEHLVKPISVPRLEEAIRRLVQSGK